MSLTLYGATFTREDWTEVPASYRGKIVGHDHFEIDTDRDGEPDPGADELRAKLSAKGVKFHHKAGVAKLKQLLAESEG